MPSSGLVDGRLRLILDPDLVDKADLNLQPVDMLVRRIQQPDQDLPGLPLDRLASQSSPQVASVPDRIDA
jgi:hypothetical protein